MFARKRMIVMGAHLLLSVCASQIPLRAHEGSVGDLPPPDVSAASSGTLGELALLGTERLGTRLYNQRRSFKVEDGNMLYTTVDKVNQWHLNGVFANLVSTHVDRWEVLGDGRVVQRKATVLPKTYNRQDMVMDFSTGILHLIVGETQDVFPLLLMDWKIDPLPSL